MGSGQGGQIALLAPEAEAEEERLVTLARRRKSETKKAELYGARENQASADLRAGTRQGRARKKRMGVTWTPTRVVERASFENQRGNSKRRFAKKVGVLFPLDAAPRSGFAPSPPRSSSTSSPLQLDIAHMPWTSLGLHAPPFNFSGVLHLRLTWTVANAKELLKRNGKPPAVYSSLLLT